MELIPILLLNLLFSLLVGHFAYGRGWSRGWYFFISFVCSPLLGLLFVVLRGRNEEELRRRATAGLVQCPYCREWVQPGAVKCRYCGSEIGQVRAAAVASFAPAPAPVYDRGPAFSITGARTSPGERLIMPAQQARPMLPIFVAAGVLVFVVGTIIIFSLR